MQREPVAKIGAAVLFAALVGAANWAIAAWSYTQQLESVSRFGAALAASCVGLSIVLIVDRQFVYWIDTAGTINRGLLLLYAVLRIGVVLAMSSLTSQAVLPVFMGSDLAISALEIQESSDAQRVETLKARFDLPGKDTAIAQAGQNVERLQQALTHLPADVQSRLIQASNCWQHHTRKKADLRAQGYSAAEARAKLRSDTGVCQSQERSAHQTRSEYLSSTRAQLVQATEVQQSRQDELSGANTAISERMDTAHKVEQAAYNERSTDVLYSMLSTKPAALVKWLIINFLLLTGELLPLLLKAMAGQSNIGKLLAANKQLEAIKINAKLLQDEHDFAVLSAVNRTSTEAVQSALQNPAMRTVFNSQFAEHISALAPLEAARSLMRELEERALDVDQVISRHPRYAQVIMQAWTKAIDETVVILSANPEHIKPEPA